MKAEENPFRSSAVAKLRYRIGPGELAALVARLEANGWRGCLLGSEGSGKTTLLHDIQPCLEDRGIEVKWVRLNLDSTPARRRAAIDDLGRIAPGQCCFFDGGEVLGRLAWRKAVRRHRHSQGGLIATVHRRCGLPVAYRTDTDFAQTVSLAAELAGNRWNNEMAAIAAATFERSRGNAREVFRSCYWYCALRL